MPKTHEGVLARFADDERLLHERIVLSCGKLSAGGSLLYTVVTPDRDVEESTLAAPRLREIISWPLSRKRVPEGVKLRGCDLFEHAEADGMEIAELSDLKYRYGGHRADVSRWPLPVSEVPAPDGR